MRVSSQQTSAASHKAPAAKPTKPLTVQQEEALLGACMAGKMGKACAAPKDLSNFTKTNLQPASPAIPGQATGADEINVYQSKTMPLVLFIEDKTASGSKWSRMTKIPVTHTKSS